ncbi:MAG: hypothetical protein WAT36_12170, partial [Chromatiaceae bacterium]
MSGHTAWCGALLDPEHEIPAALITWNGSDPASKRSRLKVFCTTTRSSCRSRSEASSNRNRVCSF